MAKRKDNLLKLPDDFLGTVRALLKAQPMPKRKRAKARKPKKAKD